MLIYKAGHRLSIRAHFCSVKCKYYLGRRGLLLGLDEKIEHDEMFGLDALKAMEAEFKAALKLHPDLFEDVTKIKIKTV